MSKVQMLKRTSAQHVCNSVYLVRSLLAAAAHVDGIRVCRHIYRTTEDVVIRVSQVVETINDRRQPAGDEDRNVC